MLRLILLLLFAAPVFAVDPKIVDELLKRRLLDNSEAMLDVHDHVKAKIPVLPVPGTTIKTAADWDREIARLRQDAFTKVVFRGEAAAWRDAKTKVEYLETIEQPGYRIKKLRYEILPDFWIPALLYEPEKLVGKVPVSMAVNGHDSAGKIAGYKQTRCINMAKRGMIVLNVEWLGMGQLKSQGNRHGVMNQLDLCGSSGIAPFYISMARGLDLLLAHKHADSTRVTVNGLSGGGWQTIFISGLDGRVTLSNPVAGYSSFFTRIDHHKDLGDSEQTPCDLATVLDYTHLTAMLAPKAALLTFNAKDNCCFEAGYAMEPLRAGAEPYFKLYGREKFLRTHVNSDPGDHNFGKDNRQALYQMLGDVFYPNAKDYSGIEIPCEKELLKKEQADVALPENNIDMHTLAMRLAEKLPKNAYWPKDAAATKDADTQRQALAKVLRLGEVMKVDANFSPRHAVKKVPADGVTANLYQLKLNERWTVPVVELLPAEVKGTTLLIGDQGRTALSKEATELVNAGQRVLVTDLYYFGEGRPSSKDWLWSLMLATVGDRALGLQTNELLAVAKWANAKTLTVKAIGPRTSTIAFCAAALAPQTITALDVVNPLGSLKQVLEENRTVDQTPELFCFGLLERFDIANIAALVAPREVRITQPSDRAKKSLQELNTLYKQLGSKHVPLP